MDFKELGISEDIINVLKKEGITEPTAIQKDSIRLIKERRDVIADAPTGTGKTLAFLIPVFENISTSINTVQALIVLPTRELAIQTAEEAVKLSKAKSINILAAYGGKDIGSQLKKLKKNIQLIIATPGRLLDHIERKTIDLSRLKILVLDEADQLLYMGFKNEIEAIIKATSKKRQTLCFSATISTEVKKLAYRYMKDPVSVTAKRKEITFDNIRQDVIETTDRRKQDALCSVLDQDRPFMAIIFCRTKRRVDNLEMALYHRGYNCIKLHSDIPQPKRERIMQAFRKGDIQYLIATDVAARGLDISGVSHIYNYDIPESTESYIHRIGRTGRAGEEGYTCLFIDKKDERELEEIEKAIKIKIPRRELERQPQQL